MRGQTPGAFERKLQKRADFGWKKRFLSLFLEPANPFNPAARRPVRRTVGTLGLLAAAALALILYFQF